MREEVPGGLGHRAPAFLLWAQACDGAKISGGSTHVTNLLPTRQDDRHDPSLSEPWFSQGDRPSQGKHRDSSHRSPRKLVNVQRAVNSVSCTRSQQAENSAGDSDLSKGKTDTKATLGLFVSETPHTLKTSRSFVHSKHQGLMQPACPLHPPSPRLAVTGQVLQSCPPGTHNAGG